MAIILNIDTALENASVFIADDEKILAKATNADQKNHASFLQPAIEKLFRQIELNLQQIDAVSVVYGPGSYTGLRVAMASAKGICYALNKPLITINTLELMAYTAIQQQNNAPEYLYCPMIDARRMEVFTAVYNTQLQAIMPPSAVILSEEFLSELLKMNKIICTGNGSRKLTDLIQNSNMFITDLVTTPQDLQALSLKNYQLKNFADLAYSEPFYLKDFYTTQKK